MHHGLAAEVVHNQSPAPNIRIGWPAECIGQAENDARKRAAIMCSQNMVLGASFADGIRVNRTWDRFLCDDPSQRCAVYVRRRKENKSFYSGGFGCVEYHHCADRVYESRQLRIRQTLDFIECGQMDNRSYTGARFD
jgi:hypothetical protein